MTYLEKVQSLYPDRERGEIIRDQCPGCFFLIPPWKHKEMCLDSGNCYTCWNQKYKEEPTR